MISVAGAIFYRGSLAKLAFFDMAFLLVALLAVRLPHSYAYSSFGLFLTLGFWVKLHVHLFVGYPFLEPTGRFGGDESEWDHVLVVSGFAALGTTTGRLLSAFTSRQETARVFPEPVRLVPAWYAAHALKIWVMALGLALALNVGNSFLAFYQIGVNPKLILPTHLNVVIAWLIDIGLALGFALLIGWEFARQPDNLHRALGGAMLEAMASASSALSRSIYPLKVLAYLLAILEHNRQLRPVLRARISVALGAFCAVALVATVSLVTWGRLELYPPTYTLTVYLEKEKRFVTLGLTRALRFEHGVIDPAQLEELMASTLGGTFVQLSRLVVDRWVGLEGIMAVSAHPDLGPGLLFRGVTESPKRGNDAIYQKIAESQYAPYQEFTFLTLPGIVAILYYSGSVVLVGAGMALVTLIMLWTEALAMRMVGNAFFVALVGVALANVVCNLSFPYLGMVFLAQMIVAILFAAWVQRDFALGPRPAQFRNKQEWS